MLNPYDWRDPAVTRTQTIRRMNNMPLVREPVGMSWFAVLCAMACWAVIGVTIYVLS